MSLNYVNLQNKLYSIFDTMNNIYGNGDEYMATEVANEIKNYILNGKVSTSDVGTGSAGGAYVGKGSGTMTINSTTLRNKLLTTFLSQSDNYELARRMASDINSVCSQSNIIRTTTVGQSTTSQGTYTDSGVGIGSFVGNSNIISTKLSSCFDAMYKMTNNGNMYFAQELAKSIDNYLKSGTITVRLQTPMSGSGSGKIS